MSSSVPEIIGANVKARRNELGMSARALGEQLGECLPRKDGSTRPWPTSAVFQLESGGRGMTPEEVAALARVLDCPISDLYVLEDRTEEVRVGNATVPASEWRVLPAASSVDDRVALRLFHAAENVHNSMRQSEALWRNLVNDVRAAARESTVLRERIEEEAAHAMNKARQQIADAEERSPEDVTDAEIIRNATPKLATARAVLEEG